MLLYLIASGRRKKQNQHDYKRIHKEIIQKCKIAKEVSLNNKCRARRTRKRPGITRKRPGRTRKRPEVFAQEGTGACRP